VVDPHPVGQLARGRTERLLDFERRGAWHDQRATGAFHRADGVRGSQVSMSRSGQRTSGDSDEDNEGEAGFHCEEEERGDSIYEHPRRPKPHKRFCAPT
jgi:hypothetical protein